MPPKPAERQTAVQLAIAETLIVTRAFSTASVPKPRQVLGMAVVYGALSIVESTAPDPWPGVASKFGWLLVITLAITTVTASTMGGTQPDVLTKIANVFGTYSQGQPLFPNPTPQAKATAAVQNETGAAQAILASSNAGSGQATLAAFFGGTSAAPPTGTAPAGTTTGILTPAQVMQYAQQAGFPTSALVEAAAYAGIESGWNPTAVSSSGCVGLWQICGQLVPGDLKDPGVNAANAYAKWSACGGSFSCDWSPYDQAQNNPRWSQYYSQAQQAAGGTSGAVLV